MTDKRGRKFGINFLLIGIIAALTSCGMDPSPLEKMAQPIRVVRNDTITQVEDNDGRMYTLNSYEEFDYATALLSLGDTLKDPMEI